MKKNIVVLIAFIITIFIFGSMYLHVNSRLTSLEKENAELKKDNACLIQKIIDFPMTIEEQSVYNHNLEQLSDISFADSLAKETLDQLITHQRIGRIPNIKIIYVERATWAQTYESNGLPTTATNTGLHIITEDKTDYYITFDGVWIDAIWKDDGSGDMECIWMVVY